MAAPDRQLEADATALGARLLAESKAARQHHGPAAMRDSVARALARWEARL